MSFTSTAIANLFIILDELSAEQAAVLANTHNRVFAHYPPHRGINMKISTTPFNYTYHHSRKAGNPHGIYILHNIDVYNEIIVDDVKLRAVYRLGESYKHNDSNCPTPELELSERGTNEILILINNLYESDFEDNELIADKLYKINALCPVIDNTEKLFKIYELLNDNKPTISEILDPEIYTDNEEDYIEDECTGTLTLKTSDS